MAMGKCRECGTEVSDEAKTCPKCGTSKPIKKTSLLFKLFIGFFGIAVFGSVITSMNGGSSSKSPNDATKEPPARVLSPKEKALASVTLEKLNWKKGGFDSVMLISTKIKNDGVQDVKDIEIECTHFSNSGTRIDSNKKVIYELVKAGKSVSIKDFGMGFIKSQASSTSCSITDLTVL